MCFVYFLSFLDKSTLNYANAYGLQADLHLVGREYCLLHPYCDTDALRNMLTDSNQLGLPPSQISGIWHVPSLQQ
jgi:hypothetical protein